MNTPHVIIVGTNYVPQWGDYKQANRLLLPIHGRPLIQRTIEQLSALGIDDPVLVGCGSGCGNKSIPAPQQSLLSKAWLADGVDILSKIKRSLVLFGETTFSDAAIEKLVNLEGPEVWWAGRSKNTRGHRAIFAVSLPTLGISKLKQSLRAVATSRMPSDTPSMWPVFQHMQGRSLGTFSTDGPWIEIDDSTDYFPKPGDYSDWRRDFDGSTSQKAGPRVEVLNRPIKPD